MLTEGGSKERIAPQFAWELSERVVFALAQFAIQVLLARLLAPDDFGALAIMLALLNVGVILAQSGLNTALVQKDDLGERDYSIAFWLSLGISALLAAAMLLAAPAICSLFGMPGIVGPVRAASLAMLASAPASVGTARLMRAMNFKLVFATSAVSVVSSGVAGVLCALGGLGLWALVVQQVGYQAILSCALMVAQRWRPQFAFCVGRARELFSFGWKVAAAKLLDTGYSSCMDLVLGRLFGPASLGFVDQGRRWPQAVAYLLDGSVQPVLLAAVSREQHDPRAVKGMARKTLGSYAFLLVGAMWAVAACATPLVEVLLGDKWLPCAPYLQIYAAVYSLLPLHTVCTQSMIALGRSDVVLKLEVAKKGCAIALFLLAMAAFRDMEGAVASFVAAGVVAALLNAAACGKLFGYGAAEQLRDVAPVFALGAASAAAAWAVSFAQAGAVATLALQVLVFAAAYVGLAALFKLPGFMQVTRSAAGVLRGLRAKGGER